MNVTPSINYRCPDCGATTTYQLVPMETSEPQATHEPAEMPSIDFRCPHCGASHTYTLSPASPSS
jgi:predicted RNA-binding Zn-ribbon protein involved in translation (DUF1610 family)